MKGGVSIAEMKIIPPSELMGYTTLVINMSIYICTDHCICIEHCIPQDKEHWMKLCERVTIENCLVAGDTIYPRPRLLKDKEITPDFKTSATVLHMENINTVTDVIAAAKKMKGTA